MGQFINGLGELGVYLSIRNYIYARIEYLMEQILSQNLTIVLTIIVALLTLWVMVQGFLIATGRSQEGLKGFAFSLGKTYFIVLMSLAVASTSQFALRTLTDTLADSISHIMRGDSKAGAACLTKSSDSFVGCKIDQNLTMTQSIMGVMNKIDTAEHQGLIDQVNQAKWFAGVGSAGPGVVAGTMLIVFRIAMALFVGFAPIFILCLLFKKTAPLFQKWLYYGLATLFSGVMLGVMADIAMDLVSNIGTSLFLSKKAVYFLTGESVLGISDAAAQQLGLGLILSTILVIVPPMAGAWFNGVMGSFSGYNPIERWNSPNNGQQVTIPGHNAPPQNNVVTQVTNRSDAKIHQSHHSLSRSSWLDTNAAQNTNTIKPQGQSTFGQAATSDGKDLIDPKK